MVEGRSAAVIGRGTDRIFVVNRPQTPDNIGDVGMRRVHLIGNLACDQTRGIGAHVELVGFPIHRDLSFARPFAAGNDIEFVSDRILDHDPVNAVAIRIHHCQEDVVLTALVEDAAIVFVESAGHGS